MIVIYFLIKRKEDIDEKTEILDSNGDTINDC